jgi:hypothetical protein
MNKNFIPLFQSFIHNRFIPSQFHFSSIPVESQVIFRLNINFQEIQEFTE